MTLEILTPERKIFSGDVYGVQLPGIAGLFEVLDKHAPMVSALKEGRLKILKDKTSTSSYNQARRRYLQGHLYWEHTCLWQHKWL